MLLYDHFLDIADFIGASAMTLCCICLPFVFYLKVFWARVHWAEKAALLVVLLVCASLGCYVSYHALAALVTNASAAVKFPFCPAGMQQQLTL